MKFSVFQVSRRGGRAKNEDRMGYCYTRDSALLVLADGMGGHPEGEVAAQLALQTIAALHQRDAQPALNDPLAFLSSAVLAAHRQILRYAQRKAMFDTPRTTIVAAVLQEQAVSWVHCGDSRLYLVRGGKLLTRTIDHSPVERPHGRAAGEAVNRNLLLTCLGSSVPPQFELSPPMRLQCGDRLLLCSDGLWGMLDDALMVRMLASGRPVSDVVPELAEMALRKGGGRSDNVTLIALEWEQPDAVDNRRAVSTDSISEGVFASTIQTGMPTDGDRADLDEQAIDRSIAEINDAIRQSAARRA
ncbi:MAG: PP2C family serine/threonine-protein phosphatase [Pseudomonadota bacterium]